MSDPDPEDETVEQQQDDEPSGRDKAIARDIKRRRDARGDDPYGGIF